MFFGPSLISWYSKKQPTICKSSIEVEHQVVAYTIAETIKICKLLDELGVQLPSPTMVYCDNISASYTIVNLAQHDRKKDILVDYHFHMSLLLVVILLFAIFLLSFS